MDILGIVVGILCLCGTCFAIGYQIGKDMRKINRGESPGDNNDIIQ